jgi:ribosomal-protein-alanine N-acetyltransferase
VYKAIVLMPVPLDHLRALADGLLPPALGYDCAPYALPPDFVAARALDKIARGASELWCATYYVLRQTDRMIIGGCGFKDDPVNGKVEIGYAISPDCRGQGAATEAVRQLIQRAFAQGAVQVWAEINPDNIGSLRVVQKLSFAPDGSYVDESGEKLLRWVANAA